ncbi:MAG: hypothetical protein HC926_02435 [Synechococcaceae cyanobacterium SM2_3_60]|nr:hypothetical protein [Synechococcaceae cyanobacterium SM2_3_60]
MLQHYDLPGLRLSELPTDPEALAQQWYACYRAQAVLVERENVAIAAKQHWICVTAFFVILECS